MAHTSSRLPKYPGTFKLLTACAAVSGDEVREAVGGQIGRGKEERDSAGSTCEYVSSGGHVTIALRHSPEKLDLDAEIQTIHAALPHAKLREVNGIGIRAFFLDMDTAGTQLNVLRGDYDYLLVSVLGYGDAEHASAPAEKIARLAIGRL